jgi:hypothetical protein
MMGLSKCLRFLSLPTLPAGFQTVFRDSYFIPQKPAVFPRGLFLSVPAISRWFTIDGTESGPHATLDYDYLNKYGNCHVPLELTVLNASPEGTAGGPTSTAQRNKGSTFSRSYAPFELFLSWTRSVQQQPDSHNAGARLYLAQCQLLDLPPALRADFPTPSIVGTAGKGDVYDTNIWLGLAPTYTPLHRDPNPNLFVQLAGSKRVRLLAPEVGQELFNRVRTELGKGAGRAHAIHREEDMMQGLERERLDEEVWGDNTQRPSAEQDGGELSNRERWRDIDCKEPGHGYEVELHAGDGLFIPVGWWHSIKGVGHGITASVRRSNPLPKPFTLVPDLLANRTDLSPSSELANLK